MTDPFALLGLTPAATAEEIRAAYRRRAAQVHPDLQPREKKEWAAEQMRQLNAARDFLLDPRQRAAFEVHTARRPTVDPAAVYAEYRRQRQAARHARRTLGMGTLLLGLALLCVLTLVAPQLVVALGELFVGLATLAAYLFMPLVVAAVLAFVVMSLRNF
jgi:hypothetical protein